MLRIPRMQNLVALLEGWKTGQEPLKIGANRDGRSRHRLFLN